LGNGQRRLSDADAARDWPVLGIVTESSHPWAMEANRGPCLALPDTRR
jgi:hypothetical protein